MNKSDLTLNELMVFNSELRNNEKSAAVAYLLLIGGHLGAHRFYLKRTGTAIVQLILFVVATLGYFCMAIASEFDNIAAIAASVILFAVPALILFVWVIVDLFLMSRMVREYNQKIEDDLLKQIIAYRRN
ncbi:TM2 domain-containing protein [Paenibacillus thailandensis]|uniref:TM2 domain-containing protein n=1 Tax=Paenibacillus thailandensis TaxID=393250 RepID=A0ABW5R369_9BACL